MRSHVRCGIRTLSAVVLTAIGALVAHYASAAPPIVDASAIDVRVPDFDSPVIVNLRQLDAISGSAPVIVDPQTISVLVNGQQTGILQATVFSGPGPRSEERRVGKGSTARGA